jgi:translation initiation factor 1
VRFDEAVPAKVVATLRIEKAGRSGKTVTVVDGLPRNTAFLKRLVAELKRSCGTGGTAVEDHVELQGDHRAALRTLLAGRGWTVKG